jgi:hypothetical protein
VDVLKNGSAALRNGSAANANGTASNWIGVIGAQLDTVLVAQPSTAAGSGGVSLPGPEVCWIRAARRRPNPQARTPAPRFCRAMIRTVSSCAGVIAPPMVHFAQAFAS